MPRPPNHSSPPPALQRRYSYSCAPGMDRQRSSERPGIRTIDRLADYQSDFQQAVLPRLVQVAVH